MYDSEIGFSKMINSVKLEDILNKELKISDYSEKIKILFFVFVAKNGGVPVKDSGSYQWKKQTFAIYHNLPYDKVLQATENEMLPLLTEEFVATIEKYLPKRKDFEGEKFVEDVKRVLEVS